MHVENMTSSNGNKVANQFIIRSDDGTSFQSYESVIAYKPKNGSKIQLDPTYWDYSKTTSKYLYQFLRYETGEPINTKKDVEKRIDSGEYELVNLN